MREPPFCVSPRQQLRPVSSIYLEQELQKSEAKMAEIDVLFLGFTKALCSESDGGSTSNVLMLMLYWSEKMIRNSMYLPPNTRLIHKTNNRLTLITVFCFVLELTPPPPVTYVTSYETQELDDTMVVTSFNTIFPSQFQFFSNGPCR